MQGRKCNITGRGDLQLSEQKSPKVDSSDFGEEETVNVVTFVWGNEPGGQVMSCADMHEKIARSNKKAINVAVISERWVMDDHL